MSIRNKGYFNAGLIKSLLISMAFFLFLNQSAITQANNIEKIIDGATGEDGKFSSPLSIAIDKKSNIYIVDSLNARVQVFDKEGKF